MFVTCHVRIGVLHFDFVWSVKRVAVNVMVHNYIRTPLTGGSDLLNELDETALQKTPQQLSVVLDAMLMARSEVFFF